MHPGHRRILPVDLENLNAEQQRVIDALPPYPGGVQEPFQLLLHNPSLTKAAFPVSNELRYNSLLSDKARELATLITAQVWQQGFEWAIHVKLALDLGIARETIDAIGRGERPDALDPELATIHDFCRQLYDTKYVDDEVYARSHALLGDAGVLELCWLCGTYATLAMAMNVAGTPPSWPAALEA